MSNYRKPVFITIDNITQTKTSINGRTGSKFLCVDVDVVQFTQKENFQHHRTARSQVALQALQVVKQTITNTIHL